jgi:hypothetical protein
MAKFYRFTVEGSGSFPVDMLRYDGCYPASNANVKGGFNDNILNISTCHHDKEYYGHRQVILIKPVDSKNDMPNIGRWHSFGWPVTEYTFTKY